MRPRDLNNCLKTSFISCLIFFAKISYSQNVNFDWAKKIPISSALPKPSLIAVDGTGNVITTGAFGNSVDFDPGPGVYNLSTSGWTDIFVLKLDFNGNFKWVKQFAGSSYTNTPYSIAVDRTGNIYTTGSFHGNVDFDPGPNAFNLSSNGTQEDLFICKLDSNGNFLWAKNFGSSGDDQGYALCVDSLENLYATGVFYGTVDFDPGTNVSNLISSGGHDVFILKLDPGGNFIWAKGMGGNLADDARAITVDGAGNVYTTGYFLGTSDFDPGPNTYNLFSYTSGDVFVSKLDVNGNFVWAKKLGASGAVGASVGESLAVDASQNVYLTGEFIETADFDPGPGVFNLTAPNYRDNFITKLNPSGNLIWAKQFGSSTDPDASYSLALDNYEGLYLTGDFAGTADFDPGPGVYTLTSGIGGGAFILKLDTNANFSWAVLFTIASGSSIAVDHLRNVYTTGWFANTVDFDPGPQVYNLCCGSVFVHKLSRCTNSTTSTLNISSCGNYTLNNHTYDSSAVYTQIIPNSAGCDSIITLDLTIDRKYSTINAFICQGQSYFAGGAFQTTSGIYKDTLPTAAGCDSIIITTLLVNPKPDPNLGPDQNICFGQTITLNPGIFSSYLWQDLSTAPDFVAGNLGVYSVKVTDANNCTASDTFTISKVNSLPKNFLPPDQDLCFGITLNISANGYKNYLWNTGATSNSLIVTTAGSYDLTVTDFNNCVGSDTIILTKKDCPLIRVPSAFTPNRDGLNDTFKPLIGQQIENYHFTIYNRWGEKIFETSNILQGWDGKYKSVDQDTGVFVYQISFITANEPHYYKGTFLMIR